MVLNNAASAASNVSFASCTNNQYQLKANLAYNFLSSNKARSYALIMNNSGSEITLILGDTKNAALNQGIVLFPGGNYEIDQSNLYTGPLTGLAASDCKISFVECV